MPPNSYATDTVKMTMKGYIRSVQPWSCGLWFGTSDFGITNTYGQDQINGLRDSSDLQGYWDTFFGVAGVYLGTGAKATEIQYDLYSGSSRASHATSVYVPGSPWGGSAAQSMPAEVALAVSMYTSDPGPSGRGRYYFPMLSGGVDNATGNATAADAEDLTIATHALLSSIAAHPFDIDVSGETGSYHLYPSLASWKNGTNHPLVKVGTDTRFDTQRRRENHLASTKYWATL